MKPSKLHWPIIAAGLIALVSFVVALSPAFAETKNYNEEQTAYNAAIKIVMERGCYPEFRRTKAYQVIPDESGVTITAKEVRQDCKQQVSSTETTIAKISGTPPTKRTDGTELLPGEIAGYRLYLNGEKIAQNSAPEFAIEGAKPGTYTVRTLDTQGLESADSKGVQL